MSSRTRVWTLVGALAVLGLAYAFLFTEWVRPEPIGIASQVRASILQPSFGQGTRTVRVTNSALGGGQVVMERTEAADAGSRARRVRLPHWGEIEQGPGGAANVTFSLDDAYVLTGVRVEDVPADGSAPKVLWQARGRSTPTRSLLYGRVPEGMQGVGAVTALTPGAPYRLWLEAGRRRGSHAFRTLPAGP